MILNNLDEHNFVHFGSAGAWTMGLELEIENRVAAVLESVSLVLEILHECLVCSL